MDPDPRYDHRVLAKEQTCKPHARAISDLGGICFSADVLLVAAQSVGVVRQAYRLEADLTAAHQLVKGPSSLRARHVVPGAKWELTGESFRNGREGVVLENDSKRLSCSQ